MMGSLGQVSRRCKQCKSKSVGLEWADRLESQAKKSRLKESELEDSQSRKPKAKWASLGSSAQDEVEYSVSRVLGSLFLQCPLASLGYPWSSIDGIFPPDHLMIPKLLLKTWPYHWYLLDLRRCRQGTSQACERNLLNLTVHHEEWEGEAFVVVRHRVSQQLGAIF